LLIKERAKANGGSDDAALIFANYATSWVELRGMTEACCRQLLPLERKRVGLHFVANAWSYALLLGCQTLGLDLFLLDGALSEPVCSELGRELRLGALLLPAPSTTGRPFDVHNLTDENGWSGNSSVTLLTSGSSGKPKAVRHTWQSLLRPVRRGGKSAPRWLLTYRPHLYAGMQVVLQCFAEHGALAIPESDWEPQEIARLTTDTKVQYISATPSYWRRLLLFSGSDLLQRLNLRQITLGGEAVEQTLLDALKACFPETRIVHIYATTEVGRCFSVSDGLAGFPRRFLDDPLPGDSFARIENGELFVKSANSMTCYDNASAPWLNPSGWFATGDLVSLVGDSVYFTGRKTDMINVGGNKVHPIEVERVVRDVPGVADVRVYGKASSISGQLVSCDIVSAAGCDNDLVKRAVQQACLANLAPHQRPRCISMVSRIELSSAHKTVRSVRP